MATIPDPKPQSLNEILAMLDALFADDGDANGHSLSGWKAADKDGRQSFSKWVPIHKLPEGHWDGWTPEPDEIPSGVTISFTYNMETWCTDPVNDKKEKK